MESATKRRGTPLSVRIASDLHDRIVRRAAEADQSVTDAVERALLLGLERQREWQWEQSVSYASLNSLFEVLTGIVRDNPKWLDDDAIFAEIKKTFIAAIEVFFEERP
jgi:hypothetical protein